MTCTVSFALAVAFGPDIQHSSCVQDVCCAAMADSFQGGIGRGSAHILGGWLDFARQGKRSCGFHTKALNQETKLMVASWHGKKVWSQVQKWIAALKARVVGYIDGCCWLLMLVVGCSQISQQVESKLWMMTGEDEPFGSRKIRYFDNDYCIEAFGISEHMLLAVPGIRQVTSTVVLYNPWVYSF